MVSSQFRRWIMLGTTALLLFAGSPTRADARTDYLINMLENGGNYRIRVQAATTLGRLRSKEALSALVTALQDEHELVVISASTALGQIGDVSVIPSVEKALKKPPSTAAKSQLGATLRILQALSPDSGGSAPVDSKPRYLIRVDAMGNSSGVSREGLTEYFKDIVLKRLAREPGVVMQSDGLSNTAVKQKLSKDKLSGYILSGSLIKMEKSDNQVVVKLGLNVFSNPDYNLLMMPTAEAAVTSPNAGSSSTAEQQAQERAIKAIADRLVGNIFLKLRQMPAN